MYRKRYTRFSRALNTVKDIHYFTRGSADGQFSNITGGVGTQQNFAWTFSLGQTLGYTELTSLFDRYKITKVQLKFFLKTSPDAQTGSVAVYPRMWWCPDYDDNGTENIDTLRQRKQTRSTMLKPNRPITINVRPATLTMLYNGATTAYGSLRNRWCDCTYTNIPHYGLKLAIEDGVGQNWIVEVEAKFFLAFRYTR